MGGELTLCQAAPCQYLARKSESLLTKAEKQVNDSGTDVIVSIIDGFFSPVAVKL